MKHYGRYMVNNIQESQNIDDPMEYNNCLSMIDQIGHCLDQIFTPNIQHYFSGKRRRKTRSKSRSKSQKRK